MFGFLGKLMGTDKAMETAIDGVKKGLDKLIYTDEEKAEDIAKSRAEARAMVIGWMDKSQGQNTSRRLIAQVVTWTWAFLNLSALFMSIAAVFIADMERHSQFLQVSQLIANQALQVNAAFLIVIGFYFAAPYMGTYIKSATDKLVGWKAKTKV